MHYFKLNILGTGGQKKYWHIESRDIVGNAVLLEYRYPSSIQDNQFSEYDEVHEREDAYKEAYEIAILNANRKISILKKLLNYPSILQLKHVVQTTEIGQPPKTNAIVAFHNRGNLREFSKQNIPLNSIEKHNLTEDLLRGLDAVSNANIYLTDIKSENILLDDASCRLTACFSDFCNAEIIENYTLNDKKDQLECVLDIIRHDIYKIKEHCYVDYVKPLITQS